MAPPDKQFSATTRWAVLPLSEQKRERLRRSGELRVKVFLILGPLFLLAGLWALLWLLTSRTVTATATSCGAPREHHQHQESRCTVSWTEGAHSHSALKTINQPGALGSHLRLTVGGLGPSGAVTEGNLELIAGGLLGLGALELLAGVLFRRHDIRSGREADGLGR